MIHLDKSREKLKIFTGVDIADLEKEVDEWLNSGLVTVIGEPMFSTSEAGGKLHFSIAFIYATKSAASGHIR